jgi:hypothetical protein
MKAYDTGFVCLSGGGDNDEDGDDDEDSSCNFLTAYNVTKWMLIK